VDGRRLSDRIQGRAQAGGGSRRAERLTPVFPWSPRDDPASLPAALETLAACAEIRSTPEAARELASAARDWAALAPSAQKDLARQIRRDPSAATPPWSPLVARTLARLLRDGVASAVASDLARIPRDLARLLTTPGVAPLDVLHVHRRFGAVTAADLAAAVTGTHGSDHDDLALHHRLVPLLPGLRAGHPRLPLGRAWSVTEEVSRAVAERLGPETPLTPVGSQRRFEPTVGDIELLARSPAPADTMTAVLEALSPRDVSHRGARVATCLVGDDQVTIRVVPPAEHPFALLYYTGSPGHVRGLAARAADRGWHLSPSALTARDSARTMTAGDEAEIYAHLGLSYVPPELRHGDDEMARAAGGSWPAPVRLNDIRGDLHVHTLWSDGHDSVESVAWAAKALAYEYVGISDHSPSAAASRVLTLERLERQREDIERARARVPGITLLHGVEVDILSDGRLDFPDEVLATFDVVLASLHDAAGQPPDVLLQRYLRAMHHPLVNIITHPANRLVGRHEGYRLDYDALFAAAVETGTALEVDGGPAHLDMDGRLARRAVAAGVTVTIDSDCHHVARLGRQMLFGVGTARRGGVEARQVLNARPLTDVRAFVARKRC
jgi:DNA polymerase (family 10)